MMIKPSSAFVSLVAMLTILAVQAKASIDISFVSTAVAEVNHGRTLQDDDSCGSSCVFSQAKIPFDPSQHKAVYKVGVLAVRGVERAVEQFNKIFAEYLTATVGQRFEPSIEFEIVPLSFQSVFDEAETGGVDFVFVSPSPLACVEAQYGAQSLVTKVTQTVVDGKDYRLSEFAGKIITRSDNDKINTILDLKDKIVASVSISGFAAGQLQFREMQQAGMSFINDPAQMVFTGNQAEIVNGVINGDFDVGFVRTSQVEQTRDANGDLVDPNLLKTLEARTNRLDNGEFFPYEASTPLYPEWNVAALKGVPDDVKNEVQMALLAVEAHGKVGAAMEECISNSDEESCRSILFNLTENPRCDTTFEIASIAHQAMVDGNFAGFTLALSYVEVHAMIDETNFIRTDPETLGRQCVRPAELYEALTCPPGYFKKSRAEVDTGCQDADLVCKEGDACVCRPCLKAFDVEVMPAEAEQLGAGCTKMSVCGSTEQTRPRTFRVVDNLQRDGAEVSVTYHDGLKTDTAQIGFVSNYTHEFTIVSKKTGALIIEVFLDGEQISESPLRLQIEPRNCEIEYGDGLREADAFGSCICKHNAVAVFDLCVSNRIFFLSIFAPLFVLALLAIHFYGEYKKKQADKHWIVDPKDVHFGPVIGEGAYGQVLLGEFRGAKVAVKRVLPQEGSGGSKSRSLDDLDDLETAGGLISGPVKRIIGTGKFTGITAGRFGLRSGGGKVGSLETSKSRTSASRTFWSWRKQSARRRKRDLIKEMRLLSSLRHPCITTVMGAVTARGQDPLLIMEYMLYGSLYDLLRNETILLTGDELYHIVRDIVSGVLYLHSVDPQIIHGDLKAANILVDSKFRAKVSDFGLAKTQNEETGRVARGTPFWLAPEILLGETGNTAKADMYAIGITLCEMYSKKDPYDGENAAEVLKEVCDKTINKRPLIPPTCPHKVTRLIKSLLLVDPRFRPTAKELDNRLDELNTAAFEPKNQKRHQQQHNARHDEYTQFLYQIFPRHVADTLRHGGKVEPESHENVTIFFSDIVGFTQIASTVAPMQISNLLDRLYHSFDSLASKHGVFKIETIGDAYMCASNLEGNQASDHAKRIAEFAFDAVEVASATLIDQDDPTKGFVQIRVGFHSGPVVSNVVGSLNARYGLFGDTVNTAARMESTSDAGRIQCSEVSAKLLHQQAPTIPVVQRGKTSVKGKGSMMTYWVN